MGWYHSISSVHPGGGCIKDSIHSLYTLKGLRTNVLQYCKRCDIYQRCKRTHEKKYGLLPEKEREVTKWSRINVDLWGPKTVNNKNR